MAPGEVGKGEFDFADLGFQFVETDDGARAGELLDQGTTTLPCAENFA